MEKRKIAIVGSRSFPLPTILMETLDEEGQAAALETGKRIVFGFMEALKPGQHVVISGGAKGVDSWAAEYANEHGIRVVEIRPNWKKYGKGAGFKRNKEIVEAADDVLAFWDGQSRGTLDTIRKAHKLERPYAIIGPDGQVKLHVTDEAFAADRAEGGPKFEIPKGAG